ncbi:hypothetical protein PABG_04106 [Paracoccidioides brasiliensis Pb03]|uniref:Uncharacterized protein n=2 Tax=Paracoccidioides brasiliensis TaxID=121759 RepID=C1GJX9_PARBD|nr:uncharacterized protein PADG_07565 [Paracoccidioides brasiliensis Pb18]EEH21890.1 hypothetical protein PABG_04106 [Paracoccidioides brasiliensis Pb03]EEH42745.2 hypothetical protein PADG_07565 [Paracoccidioides brasiliensis Pb18]ODH27071.1 hypothetical protein ACO22_04303 [Paracoccidioides brasiliensis]ODH52799.1 hypothetical protein GX48_00993 [Paracoccidioides brasiliensis]
MAMFSQTGWAGAHYVSVPGGGAYYFAKKSVNASRANRHEEILRRREEAARQEKREMAFSSATSDMPASSQTSPSPGGIGVTQAERAKSGSDTDDTASPSREAGHDPAATRHEPETQSERVHEKGKYEAAEPYRPKRGNRL